MVSAFPSLLCEVVRCDVIRRMEWPFPLGIPLNEDCLLVKTSLFLVCRGGGWEEQGWAVLPLPLYPLLDSDRPVIQSVSWSLVLSVYKNIYQNEDLVKEVSIIITVPRATLTDEEEGVLACRRLLEQEWSGPGGQTLCSSWGGEEAPELGKAQGSECWVCFVIRFCLLISVLTLKYFYFFKNVYCRLTNYSFIACCYFGQPMRVSCWGGPLPLGAAGVISPKNKNILLHKWISLP